MQKRSVIFASLAASLAIFGVAAGRAQQPAAAQDQSQTQNQTQTFQGRGQGMRGMGGFPAGARGTLGTVTEVAPDHYTIQTDTGESWVTQAPARCKITPGTLKTKPRW